MYFNYYTYYENENEEELLNEKETLKNIYRKNKEFYKSDTYKRFFL